MSQCIWGNLNQFDSVPSAGANVGPTYLRSTERFTGVDATEQPSGIRTMYI